MGWIVIFEEHRSFHTISSALGCVVAFISLLDEFWS
jgi:hypothetical protein